MARAASKWTEQEDKLAEMGFLAEVTKVYNERRRKGAADKNNAQTSTLTNDERRKA